METVLLALTLSYAFSFASVAPPIAGDSVHAALAGSGSARVLVLLERDPAPLATLQEAMHRIASHQEAFLASLEKDEFTLRRRFQTVPALAGEVSSAGLQKILGLKGVVRVDLDEGGTGTLAQAVPLTRSSDVQAMGFTGAGVTVGILDSGLDRDHADLASSLAGEACFCSKVAGPTGCCPNGLDTQFGPGAAEDDHGHGSNVTGIVTSDGVIAPVGTAPDASVVLVKVLDNNNAFCCSSDVIAALDWILANRPDVDVINMSLGTSAQFPGNCDAATSYTQAFSEVIGELRSRGVASFAASGNNRSGTHMNAPACVAQTISVGAVWDANVGGITTLGCSDLTTAADKVTCFANSNATTDIFAPGAPITSDYRNGGTSTFYGTSQASAHVAGCAANLLEASPSLAPSSLEAILEATGPPVTASQNGLSFPRVDCLAALEALTGPSGRVPDGGAAPGTLLTVVPGGGGQVALSWGASCSVGDSDYEIYEGSMGNYQSHAPRFCSTGGATTISLAPAAGSVYYLVVPRNISSEGSHGWRSDGAERSRGVSSCLPQRIASGCQ